MTCLHPSETPPLGWLVPCLAVADLETSLAFYATLDLRRYGGDPAEGWAMLRNGAAEIHLFQGHIPKDLLNFRGGHATAIRAALTERGLRVSSEEGPSSFLYDDPDGREIFFDTCEAETKEYESGQLLTGAFPPEALYEGAGLDLGNLTWVLACRSLEATASFYRTLGLVECGDDSARGGRVLARRDHLPRPGLRLVTTTLTLLQDEHASDELGFRGGDVGGIARVLASRGLDLADGVHRGPDGSQSLCVRDPDDRALCFATAKGEALPPARDQAAAPRDGRSAPST